MVANRTSSEKSKPRSPTLRTAWRRLMGITTMKISKSGFWKSKPRGFLDERSAELTQDVLLSLHKAQHNLRVALCDSFNTPEALTVLTDLVSSANVYLQTRPRPRNIEPVKSVAQWITRMLKMFGLGEGAAIHQDGAIGWGETMKAGQEEEATIDVSTFKRDDGTPNSC